ncbi:MAG TPA: ABC transporter substrate-binding protein [Baekduia sp.]|nr:ABC transporter substrate-binding protein [Baekduia sp.]
MIAAGCGGDSKDDGSAAARTTSTSGTSGFSFGTPKKATGSPYVFGTINDETGPVTFPEARQGTLAASAYVNNYLGGIDGHPIEIKHCVGDASPATAARCANQLIAAHPVAILGAADVGAPGAIPVYTRANVAYLGGTPLTPVPLKAPNSVQFWSLSYGDFAAAAIYGSKTLKIKSVAVISFNNATGEAYNALILAAFKAAGITSIKKIPLSPTSPDPSPQAALVQSSGAEAAFLAVPNGCGNVLKSLKSVGYTGKVIGIDTCAAPPVIKAAAGAADGMYFTSPFVLQAGSSQQAQLFQAAMEKWASPGTLIDSISTAGFATVMNVHDVLSKVSGKLTTNAILKAFKSGSDHPNFLSHPYTCDGKQLAGAPAVCNANYLVNQIKGDAITQPSSSDWIDTNAK